MPRIDASPSAAVADIQDRATIMVGGFGGAGDPGNLVEALVERGVRRLTLSDNYARGLLEER